MRRSQHRRRLVRRPWHRLDTSRRAGRLFGSAILASLASRAQSRVRRHERAEGENRKRSRAQLVAYGGEASPRTAARPRSRASRISGINRFGWIGRVGWVCWIVGVVRARARRCGRRAGRRRRGARHARMQRIRSLDEEVDLPFNQNARATLGARLLFARRQSNGVKRRWISRERRLALPAEPFLEHNTKCYC